MDDVVWWFIVFLQGSSFTWISRARNSGSIAYATLAGFFSHSLFFFVQAFLITSIIPRVQDENFQAIIGIGLVYVTAMLSGQFVAMLVLMKFFEKGKRKVGA